MKKLFTSESVTEGHPDKVCDQISDAILDEIMAHDPHGRVACETTATTGYAMRMGEITTDAYVDIPGIARQVIKEIGETQQGVIIGRCADYVLRDIPGVTNVFVYSEMEDRMKRAVDSYGDDPASIKNTINSIDKARANYYNYHTGYKWGDFTNYNLMINSSYITEDEAAELIKDYVEKRKYIEEE